MQQMVILWFLKIYNFYQYLTHFAKNVHDKFLRFGLIFGEKFDKNERIIFNSIKSSVFVPKDFYKTNLKNRDITNIK
jgi:hypothetical protein